ncbi:DUF6949 family protein [Aestuariivirga litoralis]|uniref:DUF6949 family protein n=1 Tax=Aestuariivirga litoralis TaxID=2650924 RepID=UPI0018C60AC2|nr:hypothetical protein [Aestuariivirga litoralis]MBG1231294.1 hypothetical protein [Aestuariivirga litoralis]
MDYHYVAYLFAMAAGIASSGAIGSLWAIATDEAPVFSGLSEPDLLTPIRAIVLVFSAPTTLMISGIFYLIAKPPLGLLCVALGLCWSFVQGIFILNQVFGVT